MKWLRWFFVALLAAGFAAAYVEWKQAAALRAENEALRAENQSFKEQSAATEETQSKQRDQELQRLRAETQELNKLRNEVSQLRAGAKETERLRSENQQLRAAVSAATATASATPAPVAAAADRYAKENWAFAGYATPDAALLSAIWAMREGNPKTYLDSLSPEEQLRMAKVWENKSEADVAAKHKADVSSITGMRILERQAVSPDEMLMSVYVEGVGRMEKVSLKRVGNDWKYGGYVRAPVKQP